MDSKQFRKYAHELVDWMADYLEQVERYPVKSQVQPREVYDQLPVSAPTTGDPMPAIMADFERIIIPGITHWQSPNFFAFFTANSSYPSVLAEMLTATIAPQCMIWETSPAAAELEEKVMNWLLEMMGLPQEWEGVIQPTASDATLTALLTAREQASQYAINQKGFADKPVYRIYCSNQTHSSIEKAVGIAGFGRENTVLIGVDDQFAMRPEALEAALIEDKKNGYYPLAVVVNLGTTSSTAVDPLPAIARIAKEHNLWLHVDAAYLGSALILPEMRGMIEGIEAADSFVFNPHKWLFTNFDCSVYFVKDKEALIRTFSINPEYLKTQADQVVNNYRDWGIPLGRRFRALKLWFVIRTYGLQGLREKLRYHLALAGELRQQIEAHPDFELLAPSDYSLVCFRYHPSGINDETQLDRINADLLETINNSGKMYFTHTRLNGKYTLRLVISQTYVERKHVQDAWALIQKEASKMLAR